MVRWSVRLVHGPFSTRTKDQGPDGLRTKAQYKDPAATLKQNRTSEERMGLATTVSIVVICVMVVVGVLGFVIDRHANKLEP